MEQDRSREASQSSTILQYCSTNATLSLIALAIGTSFLCETKIGYIALLKVPKALALTPTGR